MKLKSGSVISASALSRRSLFGMLASAVLPGCLFAQRAGISISKLHSCELRVRDVDASVQFYQALFGMPVQAVQGDRVCLRVGDGPQFMALRPLLADEQPAITRIGYSVERFDSDAILAALEAAGYEHVQEPPANVAGIDNAMRCWTSNERPSAEVYFADARGLIVQLCDVSYCGDISCLAPALAQPGLIELEDLNHFTVFLNDGAEANRYYQELFGLAVQAYQGPQAPVTGIGDGFQFVMYAGPARDEQSPAVIHHGSFSMPAFEVDEVLEILTNHGLQARGERDIGPLMHYVSLRMPERGGVEGGTPEVYFTDPDGILMQIQDLSYCGGGGYLGSECLAG